MEHFSSSYCCCKLRLAVVILCISLLLNGNCNRVEAVWCVARSGATDEVLQSALDYACAAGADCGAIKESGLCFLPNTLQAHASYAFNSYYQRNHMSASSCSFSGAATLAQTDPSYGSCVYPASPSTAGTLTSTTTGGTPAANPYGTTSPLTPTTTTSPTTLGGGGGVNPNYMGPPVSTTNDSAAAPKLLKLLFNMSLFLLVSLSVY